jgi:hypothetical protein
MRLLFGGVLAVIAIVILTVAITVVAPYIAMVTVLIVIWKLSKDEGPRET